MSSPVWWVTGAGSGVGRVLAVALAASGAEVILTARTVVRLVDTAQWCAGRGVVIPGDLADLASLGRLADAVRAQVGSRPLAGIVHAAGIMVWTSPATASGWTATAAVNALAPWHLTLALEDLLAPDGRVLFVAGAPFTLGGLVPDPLLWRGEQKGRGPALALEAAAAKVAMARVLHRRWAGGRSAFAFHPGFVRSRLADGLPPPLAQLGCLVQPFLSSRCRTGEFLALDPQAPALSGHLVAGRRPCPGVPQPEDPAAEEALVHLVAQG